MGQDLEVSPQRQSSCRNLSVDGKIRSEATYKNRVFQALSSPCLPVVALNSLFLCFVDNGLLLCGSFLLVVGDATGCLLSLWTGVPPKVCEITIETGKQTLVLPELQTWD